MALLVAGKCTLLRISRISVERDRMIKIDDLFEKNCIVLNRILV